MAKILDMPKLSPTMEEGALSAWHKKEGDEIAIDDLLAEVETDKATMEFRAFDKGTLLKILVPPGAQVKLGQPVAIVGAAGEDISAILARVGQSAAPGPAPSTPAPSGPSPADTAPPPAQRQPSVEPVPPVPPPAAAPSIHVLDRTAYPPEPRAPEQGKGGGPPEVAGRIVASPYVRKTAREMGIDLHGAQGTGPGGRVVPGDLETIRAGASPAAGPSPAAGLSNALVRPPPTAPSAALAGEPPEVRPLSPMRKAIARRLSESKKEVPHFYLSIDVDAARLVKLREEINAELAAAGGGANGAQPPKVSLNDLLIKACAVGLTRVPACNASFTPEAILVHRRVDISVAVAIADGLVTPVLRRADQKGVVAIATEMRELAARARARKLKPEEMTDGTFSISNLGMFGIDQFAAVINPPEGAILAVGQVRQAPVVADGGIRVGQRLAMTLSCDHRVVDGAIGAAFLAELRGLVEHPLRVLMG